MFTELAGDLPLAKDGRFQPDQVIMNLILDAREAMVGMADWPAELVIGTERDEAEYLRILARGAEVGFDLATAEGHYTRQGMGVGLPRSCSIIGRHQGRLSAETNERKGAKYLEPTPSKPNGNGGRNR